MQPLSAFYSRIQPFVQGCPEPALNQALVDAAIAFCEDSMVLRTRLDAFYSTKGFGQCELDTGDDQQQIARLLTLTADSQPVVLLARDDCPVTSGMGRPRFAYTSRDSGAFILNLAPLPDARYEMRAEAVLRPTRSATTLDTDLFDIYIDAIVAGTLARLFGTPGQPYSDAMAAGEAGNIFGRMSSVARREAGIGQVRTTRAVRPRPFI